MKNKAAQKSKTKKSSPKKEVKRPANKKPRPKKYVEAKIPNLPPVPTTTIEATKKTPGSKKSNKTVTIKLPDGQTEESLTKAILSATEQLKIVADESRRQEALEESARREAEMSQGKRHWGASVYSDPGVGLIKRHFETVDVVNSPTEDRVALREFYAKLLDEEKPKDPAKVKKEYVAEPKSKRGFFDWFFGLFE